MRFEELQLIEPLLRAVREEGYIEPTPIQQQAIPVALLGKDLLGCAQTGTGKTAAFALPILQRLASHNGSGNGHSHTRTIRVLVLSPTRELATQIGESFHAYGRHVPLKVATIYGGVGQQPQVDKLRRGVDIVVATPGRLLDLMTQGFVKLRDVQVFVLDEADRMLDMGFLPDVRRVIDALPHQRQTMMFSATMPSDIQKLADQILIDPTRIAVTPSATTVELTSQGVYFVDKGDKPALLEHLLENPAVSRALVFTRTKHGANKVVKKLLQSRIKAEPIHSNKSQASREKALANFKSGRTRVLVATDIAARGLDVDNISHVINYDMPNEPETYVHRIGRTGRAGVEGIALSFCSADEHAYLVSIEKLIRQRIGVVEGHPYVSTARPRMDGASKPRPQGYGQRPQGSGQRPQGNSQRPQQQRRHNNWGQRRSDQGQPAAASSGKAGQWHPRPAEGQGQSPTAGRPSRPAPAPANRNARRPRLVR